MKSKNTFKKSHFYAPTICMKIRLCHHICALTVLKLFAKMLKKTERFLNYQKTNRLTDKGDHYAPRQSKPKTDGKVCSMRLLPIGGETNPLVKKRLRKTSYQN